MHGKLQFLLPALDRANAATEIAGDFLPRVQDHVRLTFGRVNIWAHRSSKSSAAMENSALRYSGQSPAADANEINERTCTVFSSRVCSRKALRKASSGRNRMREYLSPPAGHSRRLPPLPRIKPTARFI